MANELYRTYEVLVEESVHPEHPKRAKGRTSKRSRFNAETDGALRDTHMIFQDAVCFNILCFAGLAGNEKENGALLNPLWNYITAPRPLGIKEETEKVIRRLATHYKPLEGIKTADEFLNRVYSEPLKLKTGMSEDEQRAVRKLRADCYRLLEMYGAPEKENGGRECADMSAFANTWAGLTSKPGSDTEIPGNGAYDRVSWELKEKLSAAVDGQAAKLIDEILLKYSAEAEARNQADCDGAYEEQIAALKREVAALEAVKGDAKKVEKAKAALATFVETQSTFRNSFFENRKEQIGRAAAAALAKPFATDNASELNLPDDEFARAKKTVAALAKADDWKTKPLIRLSYKGGRPSAFEAAMFRYWLLRDHDDEAVRRAAVADFRRFITKDKPESAPELDGRRFRAMPFKDRGAQIAFPLFGKECLGIPTNDFSPYWEFDKTAYATGAEEAFKYKIRTEERGRKVRKLLNVVQAYENAKSPLTLSPDENPTGKQLVVHGLNGDPRWKGAGENKGIETLIDELRFEKDIEMYGLRESTIGGWAEVRKTFLSLHRTASKNGTLSNPSDLTAKLVDAVDKEMEANRQGFGSADFFHALCAPEYFHLWLSGPEHEHNGVKDFVPHYVRYCEWREELLALLVGSDGLPPGTGEQMSAKELAEAARKPISYTWPGLLNRHKEPSYRYWDFTGRLNASFRMPCLFRRVRTSPNAFPTYKKLNAEEAKLTLAARRLKRDRIINKDTGSSVDALWCPPLILAGEARPTAENKPRAGKYEDQKKREWPEGDVEVSFSLIASPTPDDPWNKEAQVRSEPEHKPVHFTVSFKVEAEALAHLQQEGVHFPGKSLKGVDEEDEKRKFFRWPIDIESDKVASAEAEQSAGDTKKKAKRTDVKPNELWCHYQNGFRVKESRFSKTEQTKTVPDFHILSIDLGNRFAAAFARLRIHADAKGGGRIISADNFSPAIKAEVERSGTLRLPGENAEVWQLVTEKNQKHIAAKLKARGEKRQPVVGSYEFVKEKFGNDGRGRFPTPEEYEIFKRLADRLIPIDTLPIQGRENDTYAELGDHLIFRLKRRIGRVRTLLNLAWRLCGDKEKNRSGAYTIPRKPELENFHRRMVMETLARSAFPRRERQPGEAEEHEDKSLRLKLADEKQWEAWKPLFESKKGKEEDERRRELEEIAKRHSHENWAALRDAVKQQIQDAFEGVAPFERLLVDVIEFCLPLRGRHWGWDRLRTERLHWDRKEESHVSRVEGMRGLSMRRLEQILNLRQRCQSYAKLEDRYHGTPGVKGVRNGNYNPPDSTRDERPDVCPLLLDRSNRIREQRVNQTAHLILAEALGLELKSPAEVNDKAARKREVDLHGEYKRRLGKDGEPIPRCSVIVLENLERYRTSQERTRTENSRLMKWAHRAIIEKLEDMCRPFGITLMLVDPAFSSHFDSRTGLPGVRVNQVSRGFEKQYPYSIWLNTKTKAGTKTQLAKDIEELAAAFERSPNYAGTLILAVEGGKEFVPVTSAVSSEAVINADISAAVNIGLRGVADPQRWDIFPRVRTKQVSENEVRVTAWRGWFGKFPKDANERVLRKDGVPSAVTDSSAPKAKKSKKSSSPSPESTESADGQSSQSSEYPPFFVAHPKHDWGIGLSDKAVSFTQNGKDLLAYPQGAYLKRVEHVCSERIKEINAARIAPIKGVPKNRIQHPDVIP